MKIRKIISVFAAAAVLTGTFATAAPVNVQTKYPFGTLARQTEELNRGLVAMQTEDGIYLSWRLMSDEDARFGSSSENVTFEIYCDGTKIAEEADTTNYLDKNGTAASEYYVVSSRGDKSETVTAFSSGKNYFNIKLDKPGKVTLADGKSYEYTANDASVGDLDGDGEYEIILKWDCNGKDNSQSGYTGNVLIDAYKMNGTKLWRIDLGPNIRAGAHYTQFLVYDFDGDGAAEIAMKTAPGSKDGKGTYVNTVSLDDDVNSGDNSKSYVGGGGYITSGPEYYSVFDGDGTVLDTVAYPFPRTHGGGNWGVDSGGRADSTNRVERYLGGVAYLDGVHPSIITWRGYYAKTTVAAYTLENGRLKLGNTFNAETNAQYSGQGNHNLTVADVDGDGRDEIICGALALDDDLSVLWSSGRGHGDALHIGAYDPTREGYVYFSVHEEYGGSAITGSTNGNDGQLHRGGMTLYDAADGTELYHVDSDSDQGRGMMANVGAGGYFQFWGSGSFMAMGNDQYKDAAIGGTSSNFRIFWDGDLYDELLDGVAARNGNIGISAWNGINAMERIFTTQNCTAINDSKNNPCLQADLFGDWREEVVMALSDSSALRVYTTTIPTEYKIMTLMHDSVYRSGVAAEQTAYNQPPHIGFYADETDFSGPITGIKITSLPNITEYGIGEALNTRGLEVSLVYTNGKEVTTNSYILSDDFDSYNAGVQTITVTYGEFAAEFDVTVVSGFIAEDGVITGYDSDAAGDTTVIMPEKTDGIPVTGFADGSMKGSGVVHLYIYDSALTFDGDVFDDTTTVHGYEGSTAQVYCTEHGIPFSAMVTNVSYMANEDYIGEEFDGYVGALGESNGYYNFAGNFIVTQPGDIAAARSINGITYGNNARTDAYPDSTTGIKAGRDDSGNKYLVPIAGEFSTGGRNSWMEIDEKIDLSTVSEYTFSFDILYPTDCGTLILTLSDGGTVDMVQMTAGMETDTWYTYTYHYDKDNRLTRTISKGFEVIDVHDFGVTESTCGIYKIDFTRDTGSNPINPSTLWGGWGNHGAGRTALAYMDNIKVFTPERAAAEFIVTDSYDLPIEGARVSMGGITQYTDAIGTAAIVAENGTYQASISADGYYSKEVEVALREGRENVAVTLEAIPAVAEKVTFANDAITLMVGGYALAEYSVTPDSVDYGIALENSDETVAKVDENGIIKGIAPGTARITASRDGVTATCNVTVLENSDGVPASIVLSGDDTYTPNPWTGGSIDITASVYDAGGAELYDVPVTFACDGADISEKYYNSVKLIPGSGNINVTASIGEVTAQKTITTENADYTENASSSFDASLKLVQGTVAKSQTFGGTGITFNVGARGNGGDGRSGFVVENSVLKAQTGKYNSVGRHAYITFDNAPTTADGEFLFETKLTFSAGEEMTVKISDGSTDVVTLSPSASGLTAGVEYMYRIMYTGGEYMQFVTDTSTGETSSSKLYTSANGISRIDFISALENKETTVTFDDMRILSADSIMTRQTVYVYGEDGAPIEGAQIETALGTSVTAANGRATFDCYVGANEFTVSYNGDSAVKKANISTDNATVNIKLSGGSGVTLLDGDSAVYLVQNTDFVRFIRGVYDGGVLTDAEITEASSSNGKTLIEISSDSAKYKVFAWDDNMKPFTKAFEN